MARTREDHLENETASTAARSVGEAAASAAQRVGDSLEQGRAALADMQAMVAERSREYIHTADDYVHENPWQAIGIAAGAGLLLGLLISRR